jgi:hypothetical protein
LIDNQGVINDGSMWDLDPSDDPLLATAWDNAIRTWDIDFLRDNPLAQAYLKLNDATNTVIETAGTVASGANEGLKGLATILKWAPYYAVGLAGVVVVIWATKD